MAGIAGYWWASHRATLPVFRNEVCNFDQTLWAADCPAGHEPILIDQDKSDLKIDAVFGNFAVFNDDLLFLDPRTFDIFECLSRPFDALFHDIVEAFFGTGNNLSNSGYRHCFQPLLDFVSSERGRLILFCVED